MQTLEVKISDAEFQKYNFGGKEILFSDLQEIISTEYARKALLQANRIAEEVGLSNMTLDEINAEIKAVRDAKNNS